MSTIDGLPAHVFLVHAVVVLVPLSAVSLLLIAFWPAARQRLYVAATVLSAVTLAFVPLTTEAGAWLAHHLPRTPLMRVHTHIADYMLPWAIALFVLTAVVGVREFLRLRAADVTRTARLAPARAGATVGSGATAGSSATGGSGATGGSDAAAGAGATAGSGATGAARAEVDEPLAPTRTAADHGAGGTVVTIVLAVLALVVAGGATSTIYKIGDSGARAAWTGNFSPTELPRTPAPPG